MESPRLKINDHEVGLRKIGDNLFEPKSTPVLAEVLHGTSGFLQDKPCFYENHFSSEYTTRHEIESFCFTTSYNRIKEAKILLYSLRLFHDQPVVIICDPETEKELKTLDYENLIIISKITDEYLESIRSKIMKEKYAYLEKTHHCRSDYIYAKIDGMNEALTRFNNTFFLDTDIIVLSNLQENFTKPLALSPHFYEPEVIHFGYEYGFYNAGYLFCADRGFPQYWKDKYLNDSAFYEQECMTRIPSTYQIETFSKDHNCGFWRQESFAEKPRSIHVHLTDEVLGEMNDDHKDVHLSFKRRCINYLKYNHTEIYNYVVELAMPKKLAFVHFGKCAGVYVNRYLHEIAFPKYTQYHSWHKGLNPRGISGRDWAEEELLGMVNEIPECSILHNHHVSWTAKAIDAYNAAGFFTFGFVRDPREIMCSIYYYAIRVYEAWLRGDNKKFFLGAHLTRVMDDPDPRKLSLDEFIRFILEHSRRGVTWPDYADNIQFLAEFSNDNFAYFMKKYFNHSHKQQPPKNVSMNKGYKYYCDNGDISEATMSMIDNDKDLCEYRKVISSAYDVEFDGKTYKIIREPK
jgi:hypothetical protein